MPPRNTYIEGLSYNLPHPFRAEAERLRDSFHKDTVKQDGVIRWRSSNNVPPQDVLDFWKHVGFRFNMQKSIAARNREQKAAIERYRKAQANRPISPEQRYEMEAAFGKGTTVVNVFTGRKTQL